MQRIQAGIESVAKGMDYMGERAGELIGPGIPLQIDTAAAVKEQRIFDEQYTVGKHPVITLSNEFGAIRVSTWDENIVRINAEITAGAQSQEIAEQIVQTIDISVSHKEDFIECHTVYPEIKSDDQLFQSVNYNIQIPKDAALVVDNFFGDVYLSDIGGTVAANVQYGCLEINGVHGRTHARVQGDFPVRIQGLHQGGTFNFQGVSAELTDINGEVDITHFQGNIKLREAGSNAHITLSCDSTQALLILAPEDNPDISAVVTYGKLESEWDMSRVQRGAQLAAQYPNSEATQKIAINAAFSSVTLAVAGNTSETNNGTAITNKIFTSTQQETIPIVESDSLHITAISGNVHVEGSDTDHLFVEATRVVWAASATTAAHALDALELVIQQQESSLQIQTNATQAMKNIDCESYRIDLRIVYPQHLSLHINTTAGITSVEGADHGVTITQQKGEIALAHIENDITVTNTAGDIKIQSCSGSVDATTHAGSISIEKVKGKIRTNAAKGNTYLDAPNSDVFIRHKNGDVRILCLEAIQGDFDVLVEDGNLNAFIAPNSETAVSVKAVNGRVESSIPLSGTINRDSQEFFGHLNTETHTVRLECINGTIFLN